MSRNEVEIENPGDIGGSGTNLDTKLDAIASAVAALQTSSETLQDVINQIAAVQAAEGAAAATSGNLVHFKARTAPVSVDADDQVAADATPGGRLRTAEYQDSNGTAGTSTMNWPGQTPRKDVALDTTLVGATTSATSDPIFVGNCQKVSMLLVTDITDAGGSPTNTYTFLGSPDGTMYKAIYVRKNTDGSYVASIQHTADDDDWVSLPEDLHIDWLQIVATGANIDATNTAGIDAYVIGKPAA